MASIASAIAFSTAARSAGERAAHASFAACAASSASSMSAGADDATSQNGFPVPGETFARYSPVVGGTHSPPMKLS